MHRGTRGIVVVIYGSGLAVICCKLFFSFYFYPNMSYIEYIVYWSKPLVMWKIHFLPVTSMPSPGNVMHDWLGVDLLLVMRIVLSLDICIFENVLEKSVCVMGEFMQISSSACNNNYWSLFPRLLFSCIRVDELSRLKDKPLVACAPVAGERDIFQSAWTVR